jgi:hypothetical protein
MTLGPVFFAGFVDASFVTVSRDEDAYVKKIGATGDIVRVRNLNRGGSVKCTIQQSSITNDQLMAIYLVDQAFNSYTTYPLFLKDINGTTLIHAANAWIKKLPDVEYSKDLSSREWTIDCAAIDTYIVGGALV